jgi:hypothetical protein
VLPLVGLVEIFRLLWVRVTVVSVEVLSPLPELAVTYQVDLLA